MTRDEWEAAVLAAADTLAVTGKAIDGPAPTQAEYWAWHEAECALMSVVYQRPEEDA
jgi:hypothetical protein